MPCPHSKGKTTLFIAFSSLQDDQLEDPFSADEGDDVLTVFE